MQTPLMRVFSVRWSVRSCGIPVITGLRPLVRYGAQSRSFRRSGASPKSIPVISPSFENVRFRVHSGHALNKNPGTWPGARY